MCCSCDIPVSTANGPSTASAPCLHAEYLGLNYRSAGYTGLPFLPLHRHRVSSIEVRSPRDTAKAFREIATLVLRRIAAVDPISTTDIVRRKEHRVIGLLPSHHVFSGLRPVSHPGYAEANRSLEAESQRYACFRL